MTKLYSYVVDHDHGRNPNPYDGICTLVHCKCGGEVTKRNIVEMAEKGDWILGSGGKSSESTGKNDCIIYLMRVDEKLNIKQYMEDSRFKKREDCRYDEEIKNIYALVSHYYFYFGKNAVDASILPDNIRDKNLFKTGQGYRKDLPENSIKELIKFFEDNCEAIGMYGYPCCQLDDIKVELKRNTFTHQFSSNNSQSSNIVENTLSIPKKETHSTNKDIKGGCR